MVIVVTNNVKTHIIGSKAERLVSLYMLTDPEQKIARPRQIHTGSAVREIVPFEKCIGDLATVR
jgi:hypothetical protein